VNHSEFTFVGYLIQEVYVDTWPKRGGYRVASIERECHPHFNKFQWNQIEGIENPTRFLTEKPILENLSLNPHKCTSRFHEKNHGWIVSAYGFPQDIVQNRTLTSVDKQHTILEFAYALKMVRGADGLRLLGYEVVDANDEDWAFRSILNDSEYSAEQVRSMAGPLNEYSLFANIEDAERFKEALGDQGQNRTRGFIVQVWGQP